MLSISDVMGKYIFISGSDDKLKGSVAVIKSAPFSLLAASNITFWYNMNGVGIGELVLVRVEENNSTELWKRVGRQGRGWIQGFVSLQPGTFMLYFSASARLPYGSDIALDDIQLTSESPRK